MGDVNCTYIARPSEACLVPGSTVVMALFMQFRKAILRHNPASHASALSEKAQIVTDDTAAQKLLV